MLLMASTLGLGVPILAQRPIDSKTGDSAPPPVTTLKTNVRRVSVDVVVTDRNDRPVTGLTQQDFSVAEDNAAQPVRTFEFHSMVGDASYVAPTVPPLPPNTFVNVAKTPEVGVPTVILFDALHMARLDREHGQQALLEYLKQRQVRRVGSPIAIFGLSDGLYLLQGFTEELSAPELQKALERLAGFGFHNKFVTLDKNVDRNRTLEALVGVGRFLAQMPGRKNLIWYSSSFPQSLTIYYDNPSFSKSNESYNYTAQVRQATNLLNASHVAVYPVDVRGVRADPLLSAARNDNFGANPSSYGLSAMFDAATSATMDTLADDTSGHAFYGTNDLQGAVDRAMNDGSTYYSLTYEPTNPKYDGSLRHIKVTLRNPGYNLSYRRTYYADDLEAAARKVADAPQNPLTPSLERGTPLSHGLFLEAHLEAAGAPVPATPVEMQVLSRYGDPQFKKAKAKPAAPVLMQQYLISYSLVARQLEMPADDLGAHQVSLELGLISYDEDGRKLNGVDTHIDDPIPAANYARLLSDGYHVVQSVAVPVTASSIRFAVRDIHSNRVGSLEVQLPLTKAADDKTPEMKTLGK